MSKPADSTYSALISQGHPPEQALCPRKSISTAEEGKKYSLETPGNNESVAFQVDGVIITEGERCDKLVLVRLKNDSWAECFVELKGTDVKHAIKQLEESVKKPIFKHQSNKDIRARIVGRSFPSNRSDDTMEKAKIRFMKEYRCELRCFKSGQKDSL